MYDHRIVEPKCGVPPRCGRGVPGEIAVSMRLSLMIRLAIRLDEKPIIDHEIDDAARDEPHLAADEPSVLAESQPNE